MIESRNGPKVIHAFAIDGESIKLVGSPYDHVARFACCSKSDTYHWFHVACDPALNKRGSIAVAPVLSTEKTVTLPHSVVTETADV